MAAVLVEEKAACSGVLVVDDDESIRTAIEQVLGEEGYAVTCVNNGSEALAHLRGAVVPPCLILLDLMMPVLDGRGFREAQASDPLLSDIPVVVITADGRANQKAEALSAQGGLAKPVPLRVLLDTVARYCGTPLAAE